MNDAWILMKNIRCIWLAGMYEWVQFDADPNTDMFFPQHNGSHDSICIVLLSLWLTAADLMISNYGPAVTVGVNDLGLNEFSVGPWQMNALY